MTFRRAVRGVSMVSVAAAVAIAAPAGAQILDGSFETQGAGATPGCTNLVCPQAPWQVAGRAGFNVNGDGQTPTPAGNYFGRIQAIGSATGSLTQTFSLSQGIYDLSFLSAGRGQSGSYNLNGTNITFDGALTYDVLLNGVSLFSQTTATNSAFTQQSVRGINIATSGLYTLTFASRAAASDRDVTAFVDNVAMTAVPEPASWAMMIFGMGGIGCALRRRQKVATRVSYAA